MHPIMIKPVSVPPPAARSAGATWFASLAAPIARAWQNPWLESIVRLSAIEDSLHLLHPLLSLTEVRARVLEVKQETPDCKTFVLQTNALWQRGAVAGQFVRVQLEINGRRVHRVYSLSSHNSSPHDASASPGRPSAPGQPVPSGRAVHAGWLTRPGAGRIAITVKRQGGGLVSNYLHDHIRAGSVLTLSQAAGEFVLPHPLPARILLLSAGSGITPVMAMLRQLQACHYDGSVQFVHVCRDRATLIFAQELHALAAAFPALQLQLHFTREHGAFTMARLQQYVPDLATRATWLCGPQGLMDSVQALWQEQAWQSPLYSERFASAPRQPVAGSDTTLPVLCQQSSKQVSARGNAPLLLQLEQAGLQPKHGCRIGICRSCQCVKHSGTVENLQTGELCAEPEQLIRLCISAARSPLSLDI